MNVTVVIDGEDALVDLGGDSVALEGHDNEGRRVLIRVDVPEHAQEILNLVEEAGEIVVEVEPWAVIP